MTDNDPILDGLNPPQREAVMVNDGPCLIIAGAGSGKTRVITRRVARLIRDGVKPWEIFATTFTNKAAEEMKYRVLQLVPNLPPSALKIGTFHSQCAMILRREFAHVGLRNSFTICDESDQLRAVRHVMKSLRIDTKKFAPAAMLYAIGKAKMELVTAARMEHEAMEEAEQIAAEVRPAYDGYLRENNAVDFDDLIYETVRMFEACPHVLAHYQAAFRYILVDEYQDTNRSQFELIRLLASAHHNLMVVGDEDQSIYGWRGADINNILDFQKQYPEALTVKLEQNYRSTSPILDTANAVIGNNTQRLGKHLFTQNADATPVYIMTAQRETDEAAEIAKLIRTCISLGTHCPANFAIFYRVNAMSRAFEEALSAQNINYKVVGATKFYSRTEVRDIIAYLQVVQDELNTMALRRILNTPRRGIGDKAVENMTAQARATRLSEMQILRDPVLRRSVFSPKASAATEHLLAQIDAWRAYIASGGSVSELITRVIKDTGFEQHLRSTNTEMDAQNRIDNLEELCSGVRDAEDPSHAEPNNTLTLDAWLERISLAQSTEDDPDDTGGKVSLMTLHSAKGLEFDCVFLSGVEDNILPSVRAVVAGQIEEERRLFYVGITRARKKLVLTRSVSRMFHGEVRYNMPSVFLAELPKECIVPYSRAAFNGEVQLTGEERQVNVNLTRPANAARGALPTAGSRFSTGRKDSVKYKVGQRVRHNMLGDGTIIEILMEQLPTMTIEFDDGRTMQLMVKYAKVEVID